MNVTNLSCPILSKQSTTLLKDLSLSSPNTARPSSATSRSYVRYEQQTTWCQGTQIKNGFNVRVRAGYETNNSVKVRPVLSSIPTPVTAVAWSDQEYSYANWYRSSVRAYCPTPHSPSPPTLPLPQHFGLATPGSTKAMLEWSALAQEHNQRPRPRFECEPAQLNPDSTPDHRLFVPDTSPKRVLTLYDTTKAWEKATGTRQSDEKTTPAKLIPF